MYAKSRRGTLRQGLTAYSWRADWSAAVLSCRPTVSSCRLSLSSCCCSVGLVRLDRHIPIVPSSSSCAFHTSQSSHPIVPFCPCHPVRPVLLLLSSCPVHPVLSSYHPVLWSYPVILSSCPNIPSCLSHHSVAWSFRPTVLACSSRPGIVTGTGGATLFGASYLHITKARLSNSG